MLDIHWNNIQCLIIFIFIITSADDITSGFLGSRFSRWFELGARLAACLLFVSLLPDELGRVGSSLSILDFVISLVLIGLLKPYAAVVGVVIAIAGAASAKWAFVPLGCVIAFAGIYRHLQNRKKRLQLRTELAQCRSEAAEKSEAPDWDVVLGSTGRTKLHVIKMLIDIYDLDLNEAREIIDSLPRIVKCRITRAEAEFVKSKLEAAGATVSIKAQ